MKIDTAFLGSLDVPFEDGLYGSYSAVPGNRKISFDLYIEEEIASEEIAPTIANFVDNIPFMYARAKAAILANADLERVSFFAECQLEGLDEDALLSVFPVKSVQAITRDMFLAALEPRAIRIGFNSQGKLDCVFDFSLDEEISDELLVICFDEQFEITNITQES
ncbi:MAG: DUF2004 domain-containing protein [Candidatus Accumulibacter sp.]|jgi:hypothetical protein|nr:DUF2004 domain-containing protein [Accumulibacter sp.]